MILICWATNWTGRAPAPACHGVFGSSHRQSKLRTNIESCVGGNPNTCALDAGNAQTFWYRLSHLKKIWLVPIIADQIGQKKKPVGVHGREADHSWPPSKFYSMALFTIHTPLMW